MRQRFNWCRDQDLKERRRTKVNIVLIIRFSSHGGRELVADVDQNAQNVLFHTEVTNAFGQLTEQLGALSNYVDNASIGHFITPFDGKTIENFILD